MTILYQVLSTAIICYLFNSVGILYTLPSSTLKLFSSENTTLDRIMTETEIYLMGSLSSASSLIGVPFCGYLLDKLGRKWSLIVSFFPQLIAWLLLVTTNKVEAFLCSMFLCGLSGSMSLIAPVYVNEFCQESIRGSMTALGFIFFLIGMMISYLLGGFLNYMTITYVGLTISAIGLVLLYFIKESPLYLMRKGSEEDAAKAVAFYKGCKLNAIEVTEEIEKIIIIINVNVAMDVKPEERQLKLVGETNKELSIWNFLAKSRSTRRALLITLIAFTMCTFQGIVVVQMFAEPLFEAAVPSMSPTLLSVLFTIVSAIAGFIGAYLIEKIGRRPLIIGASFAAGLCCVVLGTQLQLKWGPSWVTVVYLLLYATTYSMGAGTVPYVWIGEIFLPEIKSFASTLCVEFVFFCNFIILFIYNPLFYFLGLGPIFYLFAGFSFFTAIFCFIYIPETKGLQVDVIQRRFLKKKYQLCYLFNSVGILYTLPSSTLKLFSSENTTLDRIMTETEISLMGSLSSASTLIGVLFCGYLLDKLGRKWSLIVSSFPQLIAWLLLVTTNQVEAFLCSMFLCGLSGSVFLIAPVYINEFCQESIRGSMTTSVFIFYLIGMMISYVLGGFLDYMTFLYVGLTTSAIGLVLLYFIKESPLYLMRKGFVEDAAKAVAFYNGCKVNAKEVTEEILNIIRILNVDVAMGVTQEETQLKPEGETNIKLSVWKYLATSRSTRRALLIVLIAFTACTFQGIVVVQMFAEPLFEAAVPSMSPTLLSVLFAVVSAIAGFIGAYLIDKIGRRPLIIGASFAAGLCCVVLGTQLQLQWGPSLVTVVCILLYATACSVGACSVPYVWIGEIFLPEIKSFASTLCVEWIFVCNFIILFIYNPLFNLLGLGPIFYMFAGFSFFTAIFCFIYIPETKGLQVDEIQRRFLKRKC